MGGGKEFSRENKIERLCKIMYNVHKYDCF